MTGAMTVGKGAHDNPGTSPLPSPPPAQGATAPAGAVRERHVVSRAVSTNPKGARARSEPPPRPVLDADASGELLDRLVGEVEALSSPDQAADWV